MMYTCLLLFSVGNIRDFKFINDKKKIIFTTFNKCLLKFFHLLPFFLSIYRTLTISSFMNNRKSIMVKKLFCFQDP